MPSAKFDELYKKTREIKSGPSNDELLSLYAYAKVAQGEDIEKAAKPGMLDLTGKAKRKRWQQEVDAGTSAADAEKKYIELAEDLVKTHG
ncbi:diazepam-binding inhibitor [Periconia macrospinosa]|uniref:Diazepam-binding inhibitor n=1 Tax=Periconia macrospinosa TaxID=97972 RepID=A0A2V1E5G5_9PLEO|nr:diazepam-binding inhibitor [Periconia macrospinosa]